MSAPLLPVAIPGTHPVPRATLISEAIVAGLMISLDALGVLDGAIPSLIRAEVLPLSSLVLAVLALAHHSTLQAAQAAAAAATQVGEVAVQAAATTPGIPSWVSTAGLDVSQVMAGMGALIENSRQGVVAVADSGRHLAADAVTEKFPLPAAPAAVYPPAVPAIPRDFPIGA